MRFLAIYKTAALSALFLPSDSKLKQINGPYYNIFATNYREGEFLIMENFLFFAIKFSSFRFFQFVDGKFCCPSKN